MNLRIFSFGQSTLTSLHFSDVNIFDSSSRVTSFTNVLVFATVTARASVPTLNSIGFLPIFFAATLSLSFIGLEALEISVSPATVNLSNPAPATTLRSIHAPCDLHE